MSLFSHSFNGVDSWYAFPNGLILQTTSLAGLPAGTSLEVKYPIAFPSIMLYAGITPALSTNGTVPISVAIDASSVTDARKSIMVRNLSTISNGGTRLFALGR